MENSEVRPDQAPNLLTDSYVSFVNLKHRTDRLEAMVETLASRGITAVRQEAFYPADVIDKIQPASRLQVMQRRTPGAIGCHFSQVAVMQEALRQGKHAWVMEDDLIFCSDFQDRLHYIQRFIDTHHVDIFWFGGTVHTKDCWWHKELGYDAERTDDPRIVRTYGAFSTHAYWVNKDSIARVLELLDEWLDRSWGIDHAMILNVQKKLQTFMLFPGSCSQRDNQSDIGIDRNGRAAVTVFSGFKKLGTHWWADKMSEFNPNTYDWGCVKKYEQSATREQTLS